ncbi:anthranilate synthase family protein [Kitasatospora sp. NPDC006697]|uniref:anthranilate synthase family protein n=1 Tax=Kitasatospora sp. NPDC006697 TaxID=3364020 RepID=UPI0036BEE8B7
MSPATAAGRRILDRVLAGPPTPFALLHRPESTDAPGELDLLLGTVSAVGSLTALPLAAQAGPGHEVLVLLPYRQIAERGFDAPDDGAPLLAMAVREQGTLPVEEVLARIPDRPAELAGAGFDVDDEAYAATVRQVIEQEIGRGEGANFVIKRSFTAEITDYSPAHALAFFRRLVEREQGAHWTFIIHTGERTFVGASPERHISLHGGTAVMNPISGTYRYPASGPTLTGVMDFLADRKETDELFMVVDEELKMMARICDSGARVVGPQLKEMARLAHTEYFIEGRSTRDVREILRETLFAPTVTGSPLESACRVINRYEPQGRGYYSGLAALIGRDAAGERALDSAILIRTADIDTAGRVRIGVGATLVRHSDPDSEVAETRAKAAGLLAALSGGQGPRGFAGHPEVRRALAGRNGRLAPFWLRGEDGADGEAAPELAGRRVLVVDAEDTFTSMIDLQLRSLGLDVTVRRFDQPYRVEEFDLVVMGPGPGDPRVAGQPKIAHLRAAVARLLAERRPFLAVCLSHQVLSTLLGLELVRREVPNQGAQRRIDLFGTPALVGFYNSFAAHCEQDAFTAPDGLGRVEVSRDPATGEVHALRGAAFGSMQFHAESVLTADGVRIVREALGALLGGDRVGSR